jgi:uncharacterized protein YggE
MMAAKSWRQPMNTPARAAVLTLMLAAAALITAPAALAQDAQFRATTLNLSAEGEVRLAPDMATITLGVSTQAPTAQAAMAANASQMTAVTAALRRQGLADKDIQTSNLNLNAQYQYAESQPPKLTGYQASNQVTIRVNDLAKLGPSLDAVVSAGANQVQGISFGLKEPQAAEDQARVRAAKALAAKADLYAGATGYHVGRLITLSESGGYTPGPPMPMMATARFAKAESTPVSAGELSVRIEVSGQYELTR